jgi:hypothetical protein
MAIMLPIPMDGNILMNKKKSKDKRPSITGIEGVD